MKALAQDLSNALGRRLCDGTNNEGGSRCIKFAKLQRRAETLAEALRALSAKWRKQAAEHGTRTFTGNDHALFANELDAALAQEPNHSPDAGKKVTGNQ